LFTRRGLPTQGKVGVERERARERKKEEEEEEENKW